MVFSILVGIFAPIFSLIILFQEVLYISKTETSVIFACMVYAKALLRTLLTFYGIMVAVKIKHRQLSMFSLRLFLIIAILAPWIVELPYFIAYIYFSSETIIMHNILKVFSINIVFFLIWFAYFSLSKDVKKYFSQRV